MKKSKSFVTAAAVLSIGGIAAKALGAVYRIPLTNLLGAEGMGIYQMIFPFYTLLLAASSAGVPAAISRLIAERIKLKDYRGADKIFKTAFTALSLAGAFFAAVLFFSSGKIAQIQGNAEAAQGYRMISPAVLFVSQISVFRGYFQGRLKMAPTALSQIAEQAVKIAFTLTVAVSFLPDIIKAVSFSVLAVSISEAFALLFLAVIYYSGKKPELNAALQSDAKGISFSRAAFMVFAISVPITIGSVIMPLSQIIDSVLVVNLIGSYYSGSATALYGILSGPVNSLVSLPVVAAAGIAAAAVPAISAARVSKDSGGMRQKIEFVFKLTFLIAVPCAIGMFIFSENIIRLLYGSFSETEIITAANLLKVSALSVLFIPLTQTAVSVLVALKRGFITTINLIAAVSLKFALNFILLKEPSLNIYGAAISAVSCYFIAATLNILFILYFTKIKLDIKSVMIKPFLCACVTIVFAFGANSLFKIFLNENISLILSVGLSALAFIIAAKRLEVFTDYEIKYIPVIKKIKNVSDA